VGSNHHDVVFPTIEERLLPSWLYRRVSGRRCAWSERPGKRKAPTGSRASSSTTSSPCVEGNPSGHGGPPRQSMCEANASYRSGSRRRGSIRSHLTGAADEPTASVVPWTRNGVDTSARWQPSPFSALTVAVRDMGPLTHTQTKPNLFAPAGYGRSPFGGQGINDGQASAAFGGQVQRQAAGMLVIHRNRQMGVVVGNADLQRASADRDGDCGTSATMTYGVRDQLRNQQLGCLHW
jgi:hypothetical protein